MNIIKDIAAEYSMAILIFGITSFASFFLLLIHTNNKKKRFLTWRKEEINLGIYKIRKEFSKDDIMQELFDENIKLGKENRILKQQVSGSRFVVAIVLVVMTLAMIFKKNENKQMEVSTTKDKDDNNDSIVLN